MSHALQKARDGKILWEIYILGFRRMDPFNLVECLHSYKLLINESDFQFCQRSRSFIHVSSLLKFECPNASLYLSCTLATVEAAKGLPNPLSLSTDVWSKPCSASVEMLLGLNIIELESMIHWKKKYRSSI